MRKIYIGMVLSTIILSILLVPVNIRVFAAETDDISLPLLDTLQLNAIFISSLHLSGFNYTIGNVTIIAGSAELTVNTQNISGVYRINFNIEANSVTVSNSDSGLLHFDSLRVEGYIDLHQKKLVVEAFNEFRVIDLVRSVMF